MRTRMALVSVLLLPLLWGCDRPTALTLGAPEQFVSFVETRVLEDLEQRVGRPVRVQAIDADSDLSQLDLVIAPPSFLQNVGVDSGLQALEGVIEARQFCGGYNGTVIDVAGTAIGFGVIISDLDPTVPDDQGGFFRDGLAVATGRLTSVEASREARGLRDSDFEHAFTSLLSAVPFVPENDPSAVAIALDTDTLFANAPERGIMVRGRQNGEIADLTVTVTNCLDEPVYGVNLFVLGSDAHGATNREGEFRVRGCRERVEIESVAAYHLGSLNTGAQSQVSVQLRRSSFPSGSAVLVLSTPVAAMMAGDFAPAGNCTCYECTAREFGSAFGEPCEPDYDQICANCKDTGCAFIHGECNPHKCVSDENTTCGCLADNA